MWKKAEKLVLMIVIKKVWKWWCDDEDDDYDDGGHSIMTRSEGDGCFIIKRFPFC